MNIFGAPFFVLHGSKPQSSTDEDEYIERFGIFAESARDNGVTLTQENVVHYRSESPDFLLKMAAGLGSLFKMTFDIKQSVRAGIPPPQFIEKLYPHIAHVHISDHSPEKDCILPLTGVFDFAGFFKTLKNSGYKGDYIIELYNHGFEKDEDIFKSKEKMEMFI